MRRLILGFALVAPLVAIALWRYSPLAAIGVVAASHLLIVYPTLRPNVQWLGPVITHFESAENEVWLTIDDGPTDDTHALLDLFDAKDVKATFFVKGTLVDAHPDRAKEIVARGHSIANHSHTHPSGTFWCLLPRQIEREIDACNAALAQVTREAPVWFRAPVGMKNPFVHPALAHRGMRLVGWTARAFDAVLSDPDEIMRRLLPNVAPGAIFVLHQGRAHSVRVLERVIEELQSRGYAFVIPDDGRLKTNR